MPNLIATTKPGKKYRSLKRPRVYEALRRQGHSKQSAARISNAQAHKSFTLDQLEQFVSSTHYDAQTASLIALSIPELPRFKGEQIAPGITRIRGNLCNVHGRYGPCDKGLSGKKPPKGAARKPAKARQTPAQRAQARQATRDQNAADVAKRMAETDTGLSPGGSKALTAFAKGQQPDAQIGDGLARMGLAERASDGTYRMTPTGRAVVSAMQAGDYQRAVDGISRATDQAGKRTERTSAQAKRQQTNAGKRVSAAMGRELAKREREMARAKREAERATKKPAKGGSKKPEKEAVEKPLKVAPSKRVARSSAPSVGGVAGAAANKKPAPALEKEPDKQIAPALQTAADQLSQGVELSEADTQGLIRNGLAKLNKDGALVLTAAGMRATQKEAPAHTGVMVALYPDAAAAKQIAAQKGVTEPVDQLHLTLAFMGDSSETALATNKAKVIAAIKQWAAQKGQPLKGTINGLGRFFHSEDDDTNAVFVSPDVPGLPELRQSLCDWIEQSGFDYAQNHGFTPHITVAYVPFDAPTPPIRIETPITFNQVTLAWGDERYDYPLGVITKETSFLLSPIAETAAPSFTVFKDASDRYRWVAQSSTAFEDRDREIVSTKALADDCRFADKHQAYGPLRWWHSPGLDLGDCDFNAMHGRVLIESGTFRSPSIALKVAAAAPGLEISLGFLHLPSEPDANGVFHHIRRFERSLVPRGKASNRFTAFTVKETTMFDPTKVAALKTLGFSDADITSLQAQAEATEKSADAQQVAYKADEPAAELPDLVINGVTYKAFPPKMDEAAPAEAVVEEDAIEEIPMAEEPAEGGLTLSPEDLTAIGEAIATALQGSVAQIMGALDLEKKVAGHVQGLMAPYTATKDASDAEKAEQITQLQTALKATQDQLNELLGLQPEVTPRASAAPASALNPFNPADNALLASIKDQVPSDQQPHINEFEDLKLKLFGA